MPSEKKLRKPVLQQHLAGTFPAIMAAVILAACGSAEPSAQNEPAAAAHDHAAMMASSNAAASAATPVASESGTERFSVFDLNGRFTDQHGVSTSLRSVARPINVVAFIYTSCTETCPLIVGALKRIEAGLSESERDSVRFVLVSIDPDRDTPGRLAEWARTTGLDETRWSLLAGDDATIRELAVSLDVRYQPMANGEIAHTNGFSLVDGNGLVIHTQPGFTDVDEPLKIIHSRR